MDVLGYAARFSPAALLYQTYVNNKRTILSDVTGKTERDNEKAQYQNQIDYEQYLRSGYERQLEDWYRNIGIPQGLTIRYPELSYAGQIYRSGKNIANSGLGYSSADARYSRSFYGAAGLYGVASKLSRRL